MHSSDKLLELSEYAFNSDYCFVFENEEEPFSRNHNAFIARRSAKTLQAHKNTSCFIKWLPMTFVKYL